MKPRLYRHSWYGWIPRVNPATGETGITMDLLRLCNALDRLNPITPEDQP